MDLTEFNEIRPYNDEELPQIFEERVRRNLISRKHSVMVFCGR